MSLDPNSPNGILFKPDFTYLQLKGLILILSPHGQSVCITVLKCLEEISLFYLIDQNGFNQGQPFPFGCEADNFHLLLFEDVPRKFYVSVHQGSDPVPA